MAEARGGAVAAGGADVAAADVNDNHLHDAERRLSVPTLRRFATLRTTATLSALHRRRRVCVSDQMCHVRTLTKKTD